MPDFVHLHTHTEFSLLDGAAKINDVTAKAASLGMSHIAITDHGNMFGVPKFVLAAKKNGLTPIVGCEFYIAEQDAKITGRYKDENGRTKEVNPRYHQICWAKNAEGYRNLVKLCSYGYTDGMYGKPRIDREMLKKHAEGLIASTCCLASHVNRTMLEKGEEEGERILKEYVDIFGQENYYVEIQRHTLGDMDKCNQWLLRMAKKHNLKVIATNDVHYVNEEDAEAHDLLLALQTQSDYDDPKRFRFTDDRNQLNPRFYFKTPQEMAELFPDELQALENTVELAERCTFEMNLAGDMILPQYNVPPQFASMDDYLRHMVWQRAPKRYHELTSEVRERIERELAIIKKMGYAGYFLIVQSFTTEARHRGVYVGPGRGSAAGSVIAYVLGIIDIDPMKYDLLFERFLNPERVSPPDIDIDFDDEGRQEVIDFVVEEYGRKSVSQVITYGTMGAKTALRDVGRTLGLPLNEVNRIAKMIPDRPGMSFQKALDPNENPDFAQELAALFESKDPQVNKLMRFAKTLEGTARHTGVHACAVIIAPGDVTDYAPVSVAKDQSLITQYDGPMAEMAGLLKMDFLGLRTLSILKTAIRLVKENHGVEIDPENIPLDDKKTYELYQRGDTVATFQFESDGMRKYLRQLKPTNIEDLIAMNALYRPGPMDNIPSFVNRKHGREKIEYPHQMLEPILQNTYGIMVYQEQIMQVARTMGGYTMGGADLLRRAMGKKKMEIMEKEKVNFIEGAAKQEVDKKTAEEVYALMTKFASYGFNKCLPGNTEVIDAETGRLVRIEDVYQGKTQLRLTPTLNTSSLQMQVGQVADVMNNGVKPVYCLTTASGKEIEATANHPFYTFEGWKRLDELAEGELLATPRKIEVEGKGKWSDEAVIALGYLLAEGNLCHPHGLYFYSQDEAQRDEFIRAAETFENVRCSVAIHKNTYSIYTKRIKRNEPSGIFDWAKSLDLLNKNAREKEIPSDAFTLPNQQIGLLLAKMWEGDGHINLNGRSLYYATASKKLAQHVGHLLLRLGVIARTRTVEFPYKDGRTGYQVFVTGNENMALFAERIGCHFLGSERQEKLKQLFLEGSASSSSKDIIPVKVRDLVRTAKDRKGVTWVEMTAETGCSARDFYPVGTNKAKLGFTRDMIGKLAGYFDDEQIAKHANSDIYWDRIKRIEYVGEKQTYDLEVPGTHNFVANDIIVHNSHSAAYSVLAFKTGYIKAHYPPEYMAAVLTHNVHEIKKITFFIEECRRMGIEVLPPDINESQALFSVNKDGQIRFGLEAIKGVGHGVVEAIIEQRRKDGFFDSLFDLCTRMPLRSISRKTLEALAYAGAFDDFGVERYQYFLPVSDRDQANVLEKAVQYGSKVQQERNSPQVSLFGDAMGGSSATQEPAIPVGTWQEGRVKEAWSELEKLNFEKEVIGFYLSGHPLDKFKWQMNSFCNATVEDLSEELETPARELRVGAIVTGVRERVSRRGNKFMSFTLEDFTDSAELTLFGDQYEKYRGLIRQDEMLFVTACRQPRRYDPTSMEVRIIDMRLMSTDLFDGMIRSLCVELDNDELTDQLLIELQSLFGKHKGSKDLRFRLKDAMYHADIQLVSTDWKVEPNQDLVRELEELGLGYSLG